MNAINVLEQKFQEDSCWCRKDYAFIWVGCKSSLDERHYGRFRLVHRDQLQGREFDIALDHTGQVHITMLDSTYNPRTYTYSNPL
jgi:hypothetical protein